MKTNCVTYRKAALLLAALLLPMLLGLTGCIGEDAPVCSPEANHVKIHIIIPRTYLPVARSMDAADEEHVQEVDVLFFRNVSNGFELMPIGAGNVHANGRIISQTGAEIVFEVSFDLVAGQYEMLLIANAHSVVQQLQQGGQIHAGDSKVSVLEKLLYTNTDSWNAETGNYTPIPMLGQSTIVTVNSNGAIDGTIPAVNMIRMLASIDIDNVATNFKLVAAYLYNYNTVGRIAPNWDAQGNIIPTVSTTPNLPAAPAKQKDPIIYMITGLPFDGEIYTFESAAATDAVEADRINSTCLVLLGVFQGQSYYYRVDFCDLDGNYMPLLRNFKYKVQLTQADGPGYPSFNEALNSYTVPSNLKTKTITYDLGSMTDIVFNGQYMMGLDKSDFTFSSDGYIDMTNDNKVTLFTDYVSGWAVDKITDGNGTPISWLIVSDANGPGGMLSYTYIWLSRNAGPDRVGYIYLKAGRLKHRIKVTQKAPPA